MNYYEVLVSQEYTAGASVFTYAYPEGLQPMQFVKVPLRNRLVNGIVVQTVTKPTFTTKQINSHFTYTLTIEQKRLINAITRYYSATEAQVLPLFLPTYLSNNSVEATILPKPASTSPPPLTPEQAAALTVLEANPKETILLHGDTGTGKTRLYIERAQQLVNSGQSVLVLSPEIALLPQLEAAFKKFLNAPVMSFHSQLTATQKRQVWHQLTKQKPTVIVGTRSSLFLPFQQLGLIVLDESHEPAYKQEDGVRFHATRVASMLKKIHRAQLILGSATPLVQDIYMAKNLQKPIIRLMTPALGNDQPIVMEVVDMKERNDFATHPLLSRQLLGAISQALSRGEQSIVYLNRRGTARLILCQDCGWQAVCPTCAVALTYHHDTHRLRCHICNHTIPAPTLCPQCGSAQILFKSAGTKALELFLQKHFPHANVARFDTDNLKADTFQARHTEVTSGKIDILVGTQLLVKGHDLPRLSVIGIAAADLSLQIPDFSAEERTFQLLTQAVGRVGRGHRGGVVIVQTFNPGSELIKQALSKNYDEFYTSQIDQAKHYLFPPITHMARFWISKKNVRSALENANKHINYICKLNSENIILGPSVMFHAKKRGYVSVQIVVKNTKRSALLELAKNLPHDWQYDLEPINLL